jgi:putative MATE family efflux protein
MTNFKEFARYTSFNIAAMVSVSCYILADTFFIAQSLGNYGLAALNFAVPTFAIIFSCGMMLGIGGATKYTIAKSQNNHKSANQTFTNTAWLTLGFSAFFVVCGVFFADFIATVFGASGEVFAMARDYLRVILLFSPVLLINYVLVCFVRNDNAPLLAMAAMVGSSFFNILFDYLLIIQMDMGMFGAALATGFGQVLGVAILAIHFIRKRNGFRPIRCKIKKTIVGGIFSTGFPTFVVEVSIGVVMIVFNRIILGIAGNIGVAAYAVIANIFIVVISIYNGIAGGVQPLISKHYGSGNPALARLILRYALILMAIISAVIYATVFFGANPITNIFNSEQNPILQNLAVTGLRIYFIGSIFAGFNIIMAIYFTSIENPRPAHLISLLRGFVVILPMIFLLSHVGGIMGVWFVFPVTEILVSGVAVVAMSKPGFFSRFLRFTS